MNEETKKQKQRDACRRWREKNKERVKQLEAERLQRESPEARERRRARVAAYAKVYAKKNREKISTKHKEWLAANPGKSSEYSRRWERKNPEKVRKIQRARAQKPARKEWQRANLLKKKHRITAEQYASMLQEQNAVCAICKQPERSKLTQRLAVDHCHVHGHIRGLLCMSCNNGLGRFRDNPDVLEAAAAYIRKYQLS